MKKLNAISLKNNTIIKYKNLTDNLIIAQKIVISNTNLVTVIPLFYLTAKIGK